MPQLSDVIRIRPIYGDCDRMGVLYHANYLRFFEQGRTELLRTRGLSYDEFEGMGFLLPVAKAEIRYKIPVYYDEEIDLKTTVKEYNRFKLIFGYKMEGGGILKAYGETVHALTGKDGKLLEMPDFFVDILNGKPHTKSR